MKLSKYAKVAKRDQTCNVGPGLDREPIAAIDKSVKVTAWITPTGGDDQDADFEGNDRQS